MLLLEDEHIQAFIPISLGSTSVMLKKVLLEAVQIWHIEATSECLAEHTGEAYGSLLDLCKASQRPLLPIWVYNC